MNQLNLLGIDYGEAKTGLAISVSGFPEPLVVIPTNDQAIDKIAKIAKDNEIDTIIIGISESATKEKTLQFASKLKKYIQIPIKFHDETLSSKEAIELSISLSHTPSKRRRIEDALAAAIMLKSWQQSQKHV